MSQLTPSAAGFLFDLYGGLRQMGDLVNIQLSTWVRNRGWTPNIVAVDFIRSVAIVRAAIHQNLIRADALNCSSSSILPVDGQSRQCADQPKQNIGLVT